MLKVKNKQVIARIYESYNSLLRNSDGFIDNIFENLDISRFCDNICYASAMPHIMNLISAGNGGGFSYYQNDKKKRRMFENDSSIVALWQFASSDNKRDIFSEIFENKIDYSSLEDDSFIKYLVDEVYANVKDIKKVGTTEVDDNRQKVELGIHLDLYINDYDENYLNIINEIGLYYEEDAIHYALQLYLEYANINSRDPEFFRHSFSLIKRSEGYQRRRSSIAIQAIENHALDEELIDMFSSKLTKQYQRDVAYAIREQESHLEALVRRNKDNLNLVSGQIYSLKMVRKLAAKFILGYSGNKEVTGLLWKSIGESNGLFVLPIAAKNLGYWDLKNYRNYYKIDL